MPDSVRDLPKSIEAERIVLGKLLLFPEENWPIVESELIEDDFFKSAHRLIFHAGLKLYREGKAADDVGVRMYLDEHQQLDRVGGVLYLAELIDRAASAMEDITKYIEIVKRKAGMRRLALAGSHISAIGYEGNGNLGLAQEEALRIIHEAIMVGGDEAIFTAKDVAEQFIEKIKEWRKSERQGISTGFKSLDRYIQDLESQLVVVAGSVSMGKSMCLLNMAYRIAKQGVPVGFISLEMSLDAIIKRLLQLSNGLTENDFIYASEEQFKRMVRDIEELPLFLSEVSSGLVTNVLKDMRRLIHMHGVKVIFIDYLQLMQGGGKKKLVEELGDIMRDLLRFAIKEKVGIVVGSQINRQAMQTEDKRPKLWMLRSSGEIENSADVVLGLYRPGYANLDDDQGILEVHILKNRNGEAGKMVKLSCQLATQSLNELTKDHSVITF